MISVLNNEYYSIDRTKLQRVFNNNLKAKSKYEKTPKNDVTGNACAIISCGEVAGNDR